MKKQNVIIALYPGCISFEVALAAEILSEKYQIINATPDGTDLPNAGGLPLKVQINYSEINLENCSALLVPGGDPQVLIENKEIDRILAEANAKGILIGGICAGPSVLAKAGVLKGRSIAHGYGPEQLEFLNEIFEGVRLTDHQIMIDENIITAKPEAYIEFAVEIGVRLNVIEANQSGRLKEYYRGTLGRKIRPLALAVVKNKQGQYLLHRSHDSVKDEWFYRPLGGGIEFHETGKVAIVREIKEELGADVEVHRQLATFENIFSYEGRPGHEIVLLYETEFIDSKNYVLEEIDIIESGKVAGKAVWRSLDEIKQEKAKLYPNGIGEVLEF